MLFDYNFDHISVANPKTKLDGDTSIMTYRGHSVLQTLVRCHFSPAQTTGQRYIYTGCAAGRVIGKACFLFIGFSINF
jgi:DDB1- and CUL4-associated factor 11